MKLLGDKANNYFTNPDTNHTTILIYGSDTMRVALRRQELLEALLGDNAEEEMRLTRLSGSDLRNDPALLLDGLKASGFFPGLRAVFVEGATDTNSAVIDAAMQDWQKGDAILVLTANQLNARSKLRKVIENNNNSVAIGIYNDPPNEKEIISIVSRYNLNNFESDAKKDLIALGRSLDPGDFQQTCEKLSLYKYKDGSVITSTDINLCKPVTIDAALDEAIHIIADARSDEVGPMLSRLFGQGINPTTLCIAVTRHFRNLHSAASHPSGPNVGLSRAKPPVFGLRKEWMVRQVRQWGGMRLEKALGVLTDTDLSLRSSSKAPTHAMLERAFIRISMMRPK
ncbi:DNA polymerase III subunit delta [Amylibacter sp.]|nr:DNA polymerase III subunit delta [Amylibacter sp.]